MKFTAYDRDGQTREVEADTAGEATATLYPGWMIAPRKPCTEDNGETVWYQPLWLHGSHTQTPGYIVYPREVTA